MNRCFSCLAPALGCVLTLWSAPAVLAQVAPASAWVVGAQSQPQRTFPPKALRGDMTVLSTHDVSINGVQDRLSPGSRIHAPNNSLVLTGGLVGQTFTVNYVRDAVGMVHEVWILNAAEAAQRMPGANTSNIHVTPGNNANR